MHAGLLLNRAACHPTLIGISPPKACAQSDRKSQVSKKVTTFALLGQKSRVFSQPRVKHRSEVSDPIGHAVCLRELKSRSKTTLKPKSTLEDMQPLLAYMLEAGSELQAQSRLLREQISLLI